MILHNILKSLGEQSSKTAEKDFTYIWYIYIHAYSTNTISVYVVYIYKLINDVIWLVMLLDQQNMQYTSTKLAERLMGSE